MCAQLGEQYKLDTFRSQYPNPYSIKTDHHQKKVSCEFNLDYKKAARRRLVNSRGLLLLSVSQAASAEAHSCDAK